MIAGIWSAVLTPVDADLAPDAARALPYYRDLLRRGCDGINLLGTTGEAMSFSADQRIEFMEAVASGGMPMERMMVGTGAASTADAARLTGRAFACGFSAALVMPPFFFRDASDDGILRFFETLFARTNPPRGSVLLYNFPKMSGITFHPELVDRLLREFPNVIAGMKDSSNDARLQGEILSNHPELVVLPGSESDLLAAKARGASGCISGSVALWPALARDVFESGDAGDGATLARARAALDGVPFIPAVRYATARLRRDPSWERPLPPLLPLDEPQRRALDLALQPFAAVHRI
ncbi:MAG TPA: dihydrodipicolinate synthase family protein [Candidatus Binatia bacterium]|nr:dihydrodipicolinate synthase family protein [Candidatus Binatia bacterium]